MPTDKQKLENLLARDHWTKEEKDWVAGQLLLNDNEGYQQLMLELFNADLAAGVAIDEEISQRVKQNIVEELSLSPDATVRHMPAYRSWIKWAAAVAFILIGGSVYFFFSKTSTDRVARTSADAGYDQVQHDIAPGGEKAILTLSDGTKIVLDNAANGELARQGNTQVIKLANGQLQYKASVSSTDKPLFNTMRTPRGGQYRLTLPDGTRVWLNAESSITYPAAFDGKERTVSITGEVYFEVVEIKDLKTNKASYPFQVKVNEMMVEVLGTHFNINAYQNESTIRTTLLEGSVKIWQNKSSGMLNPGEQSQVNEQGGLKIVKNVDLEETMAWKNGLFYFVNADIQTVMRQLMRWYDIEVVYEGNIPQREFQGEIQKDLNLSQVISLLGKMEVNFRIEGRKLIVMQ